MVKTSILTLEHSALHIIWLEYLLMPLNKVQFRLVAWNVNLKYDKICEFKKSLFITTTEGTAWSSKAELLGIQIRAVFHYIPCYVPRCKNCASFIIIITPSPPVGTIWSPCQTGCVKLRNWKFWTWATTSSLSSRRGESLPLSERVCKPVNGRQCSIILPALLLASHLSPIEPHKSHR